MRVLVISVLADSATAAIQAIARAGHEVDLAIPFRSGERRLSLRFVSRYARQKFGVPHPLLEPGAFETHLLAACRERGYDAVLPLDHYTAIAVARAAERLQPWVRTALPPCDLLLRIHDKLSLHRTCRDRGLAVPMFYEYTDPEELRTLPIRFPVVVKARRYSGAAEGVRYARDRAELLAAVDALAARPTADADLDDFTRPLVQEYVPGPIYDVDMLYCRGQIRAQAVSLREAMYPASGGISVAARTVKHPEVLAYGRAVMDPVGWHGVCEAEVKLDQRDGRPKLMEVNVRFWGTLRLTVAAGMNMPLMAAEIAARGDTPPQDDYTLGLVIRMVLPREALLICQDRGRRLRRLRELGVLRRPNVVTDVDFSDLKPTLWSAARTLNLILFKRDRIVPANFGVLA